MLINRTVTVDGHRTSIRLEPEFWAALADIAKHEYLTIDQLCAEVDRGAGELSRTAAIRAFIVSYMSRLSTRNAEQLQFPLSKLVSQSDGVSVGEYLIAAPSGRRTCRRLTEAQAHQQGVAEMKSGVIRGLPGQAGNKKRTVKVGACKTSVSLELIFRDQLREIASQRGLSVNKLVTLIDQQRDGSLSSAIRVFVLEKARELPTLH